jgi:xylulokinase
MRALLGIDIGTSGTKSLLIDPSGRVLARAVAEYPLYSPKPQWSEQNPEDWWQAVCSTIQSVFRDSGLEPGDIAGIGLSGQMHGSVFIDENAQVIRPAILWNDQRTQAECDWITAQVGRDRLVDQISNPVLTGFTAGKIVWLRNHEPENFQRVRYVLLPKDYIRYRLTGEFATEVSDASGTALFNVRKRDWSGEVLDACRIPREWMPRSYESVEVSGRISGEAASQTGLAQGTPVVGGGGDQAAGAVGNGIVHEGIVSSSVGTSGVVFAHSDEPRVDPALRLHTFCHAVPGKWHLMGVMLSAGGSLQWLRDTFYRVEKQVALAADKEVYEMICAEAAEAPLGCEGLTFLPYLTGERTPYPDATARGAFVGITRRCDRSYFARAVLEGVAYGLCDSASILRELGVELGQIRASGGGSRNAFWRGIMADVIGCDHVTINVDEGPALGVALLAGVGTGAYSSVETACDEVIHVEGSTKFDISNHSQYDRYYRLYQSLYPSLKPRFDDMAQLAL